MDTQALLSPIAGSDPCGPDLRYDPAYVELMDLAKGTREAEFGSPDEKQFKQEAKEPNWRDISRRCEQVLTKSKDLDVALLLTLSEMRERGFAGLQDGLSLVQALLSTYWDGVHPRMDPQDKDPFERVNMILVLATPGEEIRQFIKRVREAPIVEARQFGRFGLRQVLIARGELVPGESGGVGVDAPSISTIDAAFAEAGKPAISSTLGTLKGCSASLEGICKVFADKSKPENTPVLKPLQDLITKGVQILETYLSGGDGSSAQVGPDSATVGGGGGGGGGARGSDGPSLSGEVRSPGEVVLALDKVIRYYERHEKSSPVPVIVLCAKRMVDKSYMEISRVLTPGEIQVLEKISGLAVEPSSSGASEGTT